MPFIDPSSVLWENICRLMGYAPGEKGPSIDAVQRRVGVGRGTVQRIKEKSAAAQLDSLTTIAAKLGVPVWKLLQPLDELPPPASHVSARARVVAELFETLEPEDQMLVERICNNFQDPRGPLASRQAEAPDAEPMPAHAPARRTRA